MTEIAGNSEEVPTEKQKIGIPTLGIYGEGEISVVDSKMEGPGMDGDILAGSTIQQTDRPHRVSIPRLGISEVVESDRSRWLKRSAGKFGTSGYVAFISEED